MGDVIGDLNSRRGMVNKFDDKPGGMKLVQAYVPLAEMFNYVSTLRGMTKGRANYRWVLLPAAASVLLMACVCRTNMLLRLQKWCPCKIAV